MASTEITAKKMGLPKLRIEKNVPMPERYPHRELAALVMNMEIGDSIFCPTSKQITGIQQAMTKRRFSYQTRAEGDGRRIWRTA